MQPVSHGPTDIAMRYWLCSSCSKLPLLPYMPSSNVTLYHDDWKVNIDWWKKMHQIVLGYRQAALCYWLFICYQVTKTQKKWEFWAAATLFFLLRTCEVRKVKAANRQSIAFTFWAAATVISGFRAMMLLGWYKQAIKFRSLYRHFYSHKLSSWSVMARGQTFG